MTVIREIFDLAGWKPVASIPSERALSVLEDLLGQRLPRVFRELMALQNGPALLEKYSNSDWPIPPGELARRMTRWRRYDPLQDRLLPFMVESQGVCVWAIRLDGGDDPPVVVEVGSGRPPRWQHCADQFSVWLKCQIEDRGIWESSWFNAQAPVLSKQALAGLCRRFGEGPRTFGWPGQKTNHRFHSSHARLLLWNSRRQCDWHIAPRSADHALATLDEIHEIAGIGPRLWAHKDECNSVLKSWRSLRGLANSD